MSEPLGYWQIAIVEELRERMSWIGSNNLSEAETGVSRSSHAFRTGARMDRHGSESGVWKPEKQRRRAQEPEIRDWYALREVGAGWV
jgi:hypothetical protein